MGTHALVHVKDEEGANLVTLYFQYDGYLEGLGRGLYDFCKDFVVVNGITKENPKMANTMECFAAQLVTHFKQESPVGNVYIRAYREDDEEEFVYTIKQDGVPTFGKPASLRLEVKANGKTKELKLSRAFPKLGSPQSNLPPD